jgi:serine/threonine-protein kinase
MATVYLAKSTGDEGFSKWVALKLIERTPHTAGSDRANLEAMFFDEARLAAKITHPNVSQIFDLQRSEFGPFIVMEYLHGQSLASVLKRAWSGKGLAFESIARIVADAARGLHAAHELKGSDGELALVVHRDVSPQNIFVLYDGVAKVVDFGIARWSERTVQETATQELRGKLRYMAPEQVLHEPVDRRTDVFALGIVLWESTLGRRLFSRDNPGAIVRAIVDEPIVRPSAFEPSYPPALETIVMRALAKDPAERFQTAEELGEALEAFLQHNPSAGTSVRLASEIQQLFWHERRAQQAVLDQHSSTFVAPVAPPPSITQPAQRLPSALPDNRPREAPVAYEPQAPRPSQQRRGILVALVLGIAVSVGVTLYAVRLRRLATAPPELADRPAIHAGAVSNQGPPTQAQQDNSQSVMQPSQQDSLANIADSATVAPRASTMPPRSNANRHNPTAHPATRMLLRQY